jgi:indolepyruvate ferredoxin oxidoreductase
MAASPNRRMALDDRYTVEEGRVYLSGVQALVRVPLDIRRHDRRYERDTRVFVSGYEGSPLAGFDLEMLRRREVMAAHDVRLEQGLNEELAANAVQGTQFAQATGRSTADGIVGIWYGKAPGLDRATDAFRHSNLSGTHRNGGVVALVGDDTVAKSSTVPSSSEMALAELSIPTLVPADAQDILDLGLHALTLSRTTGLWAGFKVATNVADGWCTAEVAPDRVRPVVPDLDFDGVPFSHSVTAQLLQPKLTELEYNLVHRRIPLAERYSRANDLNPVVARSDHDRIGIIAAGTTFLDVRQALRKLGFSESLRGSGIRLMKVGMVWPLERDTIREFAAGLTEIVVVEEKRSFLETAVKEILYSLANRPAVSGKTGAGVPLLRADGDLNPDLIAAALARRLLAHHEYPAVRAWSEAQSAAPRQRPLLPLAVRTPFFCSGCPHNLSTQTSQGSLVGTGIGCHGMATLMSPARVGEIVSLTQMGGEGTPWIGMSPYVDDEHMVQNIGDGTFHHSGSLAVRAAVAAGVNITYKLLYNSTVAMTGGQDAVGAMPIPKLVASLYADGVRKVAITTDAPRKYRRTRLPAGTKVRHRDDLLAVENELSAIKGVTVLIHDQECAAELRRKRKRGLAETPAERVLINQRVCEGCGDCGEKSGCLSVQPVETEFGRKTVVHQPSCNQDLSCLKGDCPAFVSVRPSGRRATGRQIPPLEAGELPNPPVFEANSAGIRISGVGGTGVVTVAQILATAAVLEGLHVRALDQTGLAQKGGAVISDLKLSRARVDQANKLAGDECDVLLGCDLIVAATPNALAPATPSRTVAVVSTTETPTGAMVVDPTQHYPDAQQVVARIQQHVNASASVFVDAALLSRQLFDDDQFANIFLAGIASQKGLLPIDPELVEEAITLNGVATERNIQAFRRGRQYAVDPAAVERIVSPPASDEIVDTSDGQVAEITHLVAIDPSHVQDHIRRCVAELIAYQDADYARRYAKRIEQVRRAETAVQRGSTTLTESTARHLFKLMAYKDEYEVARLSLDPALTAELEATFGVGSRYAYRLHPPVLRAIGLNRKLSLGPWFRPVLRVLYAMRRLRGTALDPFGYARVRRAERALLNRYEALLDEIVESLTPDNLAAAVDLAATPDMVRGYEDIKLRSIERYDEEVRRLRADLVVSATSLAKENP